MTAPSPQWCLVGNIKDACAFGPEGSELRFGTLHFAAGTKVYCLPAQWGDGYEKIKVLGKHRNSSRLVKMVVRSTWITNWRVQLIYSPGALALLTDETLCWESKEEVIKFLASMQSSAQ